MLMEGLARNTFQFKTKSSTFELNSSKDSSRKKFKLSRWSIALSDIIFHYSSAVDFSSEKYNLTQELLVPVEGSSEDADGETLTHSHEYTY